MRTILKKIIVCFICFAFSYAYSEEQETYQTVKAEDIYKQYFYFAYSAGFDELPGLSVGFRKQMNMHGVGLEGGIGWLVLPILLPTTVDLSISYLYYPRPNLDSQPYFGISLGGGYVAAAMYGSKGLSSFCIDPKLFYGKEFLSYRGRPRFWEVFIGWKHAFQDNKYSVPIFGFKYGFRF